MYKNIFLGKKAAFFDLDGTIIDSIPYWERACRIVQEDVSQDSAPLYGLAKGSYLGEFWKSAIKDYGLKTGLSVDELLKKTHHEYLELFKSAPLEPRDGFWKLADELKTDKKWSLALISNSDRSVVTPIISSLGLDGGAFDIIITGDEVGHRKPSPDIYQKALKALRLKSREVVVFEDSVTGSSAAEKAGLDTIAIWDGNIPEYDYPKNVLLFLPDFDSLPGNLDTTFIETSKNKLKSIQSES